MDIFAWRIVRFARPHDEAVAPVLDSLEQAIYDPVHGGQY